MENNYDIVFAIARFWPYKGGAEQNCYYLALHALAAGQRVLVLTTDVSPDGTRLPANEVIDGIEVRRLHAWNKELNLGFYPRLLPELMSIQTKVIHVCNGAGFFWRDLCLFARKIFRPDTKVIITPHGPFLATPQTHSGIKYLLALIAKKIFGLYFRLLWRHIFTQVIAVNSQQHSWLTRDYGFKPSQIKVIPNGIPAGQIAADLNAKPRDAKVRILYLGRWEKYKRVQDIITAIKLVLDKNSATPIQLQILGGGVYEQDLRAQVELLQLQEHVSFINYPSDEQRDTILFESDIIVLPSEWEATGIVLIEGMAKGCVPITSKGNEARTELIVEGKDGFIIDVGDVATLSEIFYHLCNNRDKLQQLQQAAHRKAHEFTWEEISKRYLALLKQL
jgi:glycosyltransferase involved in cell wall biosynthesis